MELGLGSTLLPGDPRLIDHIVGEVKSQGIFDQFRKDALADVDTKPAYQNLRTRVEGSVNSFLSKQTWKADLNKNQLRETLRKHISDAAYLDAGVERIVDQVVNPKIYSVFLPQIEDVVYKYLGLEKPKREKTGGNSIKDLLPIDLDPVSPESDKNSLKDVSLDSIDDLPITNKEDTDQVDNADDIPVAECEKSIEEKEAIDSKEVVENEVNSNELIQSTTEEEKVTCSTPPLVDIGLNDSIKSDEKTEEEEEDSPVFEPIDIMNFHESNVSNDSHLSGISELTSHRSRSPDFQINEYSRDHFDFSNQDSQFSKVSSDSRLSIVTDFGSSNQASTPVPDTPKEEKSVDKNYDDKNKDKTNDSKDIKNSKSSSSKERDTAREKSDYKSKSSKERSDSRDSRSHRDRDYKKKSSTDSKSDRDKSRSSSHSNDKSKEKDKDSKDKVKDEKTNSSGKESKDLKDIYKEKIRELREKKELTEKEKLNKDKDKDGHRSRDSKDKKDSKDSKDSSKESKDRRDSKEHRSSSSSSRSHRHESTSRSKKDDSKSSHDKKRDDRHSRDKSRSQGDSDAKRSSKDDKSDKDKDKDSKSSQRRKESRSDESRKSSDKSSSEKEKDKDKKRRDEKKSKSKDDHSSLRKSSSDRRSSDRDGSSGSNSKSSKNSCPSSSTSSSKPNSSLKETGNTSNSSSETSDGVDESQIEEYRNTDTAQETMQVDQETSLSGVNAKRVDLGQNEISLPLKKRPLPTEDDEDLVDEVKKPKFEKNLKETKVPAENNNQVDKVVPDNERVQIIEVCEPQDDEDDENEPYPDDADINLKLEQSTGVIMEGENFLKVNIVDNCKTNLSEMEMSIKKSLSEMIVDKTMDTKRHDDKKQDDTVIEGTVEKNNSDTQDTKTLNDSEDEDCLYFVEDNEKLNKFKLFLKSLNIDTDDEDANFVDNDEGDYSNDNEKVKESLPNEENQDSALSATMAPPQLKRKHSTSPLSDIVLNLDNNNDGHKEIVALGDPEKDKKSEKEKEAGQGKKKLGRPKRQRPSVSSSSPNDDFVMPLSPESDVSATSDKISANHKDKDDKRLKSKQRYTSDDLYKPRPLFVGSSRRNRRSNQA